MFLVTIYLHNPHCIAGITEFQCTFPSPWTGQTFDIFSWTWIFDSDCQTITVPNPAGPTQTWLCHQITERFLIVWYVIN